MLSTASDSRAIQMQTLNHSRIASCRSNRRQEGEEETEDDETVSEGGSLGVGSIPPLATS